MRGEFLENTHQEYSISSFDEKHGLCEEIADKNEGLAEKLYMNTDVDIWKMLYDWLNAQY